MTRSRKVFGLLFLLSLASSELVAAQELAPGRIRNPDGDGLQFHMATAYNSVQDEYLVTYAAQGSSALALRLSPAGTIIGPEITLSPPTFVQETSVAYNPDRNEYLLAWRNDSPTDLYLSLIHI